METRLETNRPGSWWIWALALAGSLALHVLLIRINPNLLLGQTPIQAPVAKAPEAVVRVPPRSPNRLDRELPRLIDRLQGMEVSEVTRPMDPAIPEVPPTTDADDRPEGIAVQIEVSPAPVGSLPESLDASRGDWQPRQEVMAISRTRVNESLPFLPRRFRDVENSRPDAPDIRLPDPEPRISGLPGWGGESPHVTSSAGQNDLLSGIPELNGDMVGASGRNPAPLVPDLTGRISDPDVGVSPFEPVEQLLRLQTRVWSDPSDPAYRYFKVQILRNGIEALPVLPRELVYLIDCSASMTEEKLQLALQGVRASLDQLSETDVFRIAAFRNEVTHMRAEPVQATVIERARAKAFLSELHAYGKTDVYSSLEMLLQLPVDAGRPLIALLVTDGVPTQGMMDSREILDAFTRANRGRVSVFGVGGGDRVNRLLLDFLSYRNRGQAWVTGMPDGIPGAMLQMEKATARPVLMDLRYRFTRGDAVEVYPRELSHLYLDSPLVLIGRAPVDQTHIAFQMIGQSGGTSHDLVFELDLSSAPRGNAELRREWAWQAVLQALSGAEQADPAKQADRIRALADTYNLDIPAVYRIVPPAPFL